MYIDLTEVGEKQEKSGNTRVEEGPLCNSLFLEGILPKENV